MKYFLLLAVLQRNRLDPHLPTCIWIKLYVRWGNLIILTWIPRKVCNLKIEINLCCGSVLLSGTKYVNKVILYFFIFLSFNRLDFKQSILLCLLWYKSLVFKFSQLNHQTSNRSFQSEGNVVFPVFAGTRVHNYEINLVIKWNYIQHIWTSKLQQWNLSLCFG